MSAPLVSVVLVTRNGGATLPAVLEALARQRIDCSFEIVVVDSGSTDGSLEALTRAARSVVTIPGTAFNHGLTRNVGITHARGELIVLLVQDAVPVSEDWLSRLTAPLREDASVAGAFCRQRPHSNASVLSRHYLNMWIAAAETPRSVRLSAPEEFDRLDPYARLQMCAFDNVCSCIRRSVWEQLPFRETPIAEDLEWAKRVLLAGHRLNFVADAVVVHSHERSAWYEFARTYLLHRRLLELFELRTIPTIPLLVRAVVSSVRLHLECERRASKGEGSAAGMLRALALALAWPAGQYIGGLSAARGWTPMRFSGV